MAEKLTARKKRIFRAKKDASEETAAKRIRELFAEAEAVFREDRKLADRYVFLARKLAMKYKVGFTAEQKVKSCKVCGSFLMPNANARIRISKGNMVIKCEVCNNIRRLKYK